MSMDKAIESGKEHRKNTMEQKLLIKVVDVMAIVRFVLEIACISIKKKKKKCLTERKICDIINIEIKERGKKYEKSI